MMLASKGSDRLPRKRLRRLAEQLGIALALSATAFGADAAGLGRLNLMSALGQPLRAEIDLTSVGSDEAGTLVARLANPDAFSQAGIEYGSTLKSLRFSIQRRPGGQQYVLVTSNQQINDPFLDLLVELNWGSGRLVREYTVLLDPPDTRAPQRDAATAQAVAPPVVLAKTAPTVVRRTPRAAPSANTAVTPPASSSAAAGPSSVAPGGEYVVKTGDTASSIARADKVDGASLEQMLAALYRDNPQGFSGNINRLKAGAALKIPSAETARAIDGAEAHKIVAQSANFGSYRERLAHNAAPAASAPGQQASGRLTTQVQDQATPVDATDRLRLSRPDAARSAPGTTGGTRQGAGPTAVELAEKDRELQESHTRVALLEKNVTDLQALIKLKNQALADAQKSATAKPPETAVAVVTPPPASVVVAPAAVAPAPAPVAATPVPNAATSPSTSTAPVAAPPTVAETPPAPPPMPVATPKPAPVKVAPVPVTTTVERGWSDWVMDNVMLVVAVIVLILLGAAYLVTRRRKLSRFEDSIFVDNSVLHANSVFGTTGGQSVDTANSGFHSNFVPVAGALPEHSEVDPVAEADVYIAYGRDAQAEEILKEALRADGSRNAVRLKLLEIYAKRGDAKTFETMASELYASTGGQGDDWRQAAALGASIDPHNPLYTESAIADVSPASLSSPAAAAPTAASLINTEFSNAALDFRTTDLNAGTAPEIVGDEHAMTRTVLDHAKTDPMPRPAPTTATSTPSMDLDFDLGHNTLAPLQSAAGPAPAATPAPVAPKPVVIPNDVVDYTASGAMKSLVDPFTASAFGTGDPSARTAVNLPAFRARAEAPSDPSSPPTAMPREADGFTASDIFGTSIVADTRPMHHEPSKESTPVASSIASSTGSSAFQSSDFGLDGNMSFDKTEPLDAFSKVNLDLEQSDFSSAATQTEFGRTDVWQSMATKLDLALAYSDIGDKDGARELLEEVVRNGDQVQAERAKHLITELG